MLSRSRLGEEGGSHCGQWVTGQPEINALPLHSMLFSILSEISQSFRDDIKDFIKSDILVRLNFHVFFCIYWQFRCEYI